ncbi:pentatricopeptide repeat-containing protein At4g21705, mitochondrial-like [Coffea eugenioides]|uniref:pentatricopeptide repeat-containing protein At4g21705, mitochondrial-like n=1 Tax=Coffea eugenioides TaxID=49369 RepID=UPI000F60DFD2|nr:pentatricopeptide repeat-containing protein At4g21705, mitochondrial-like [Coffea eugenioides]
MPINLDHCSISLSHRQFPINPTMFKNLIKHSDLLKSINFPSFFRIRSHFTAIKNSSKSNNLFSRISPLRQSSAVVPVLDQWVEEGRKIQKIELQRIIHDLRSRRRYSQALQVSEWMSHESRWTFSPSDCAVHVDLVGVVQGWDAAEHYFHSLKDQEKNDKTYGALLNCYVREGLLEKSLLHVQKMEEIGYASSTLVYNNLMCLYKLTGQLDKVPELLAEMKKNGVSPNNFSYRICINCYGEKSDLTSLEELLEEMENQPDISVDWTTYSIVASYYIRDNQKEKAIVFLKKLEDTLLKNAVGYNHLISLHGQLGNLDEVMRLWGVQKFVCRKQINRDYITMLGALVKLGELEKAKELLQEWESSCHTYDFRVPNILLIGYCQKDLTEKAEDMLRKIVKKGKVPTPNSWGIIAGGYMNKGNMEKAFECMKEALAVQEQNPKWDPKPRLVFNILNWLGNRGELEEVQALIRSLRTVVPANRNLYHALIKANIRDRKDVDWVLESMKADGVEEDAKVEKILAMR